ncbi:diaminohydroxyphosphoribosylaminopyrimidine deaminase [Pseudomonas duriflava]|uniref:Riboflavin biosynthesis protein RibD n=1 Tax=Pseudomonas duriflava TaxID=459528 RepID=A0A562Q6Q2_9PSED|nr:bifunctional diaminohydroxyphosphoribosylaminopyrimidine deaminase/5-amino-6-(5-phosphoribosylamino)uracil reductase RibD [Pseudomonas duriflava]TWI52432.1 diaminohydroxyphosphoribosylaminopyrimidine deaminase [Pseudomonas duriflava]
MPDIDPSPLGAVDSSLADGPSHYYSPQDEAYMARALELARLGLYSTHPNPRVGCVIVKDDAVIGEGWHVRAGEPHAEVNALREAGEQARGATAYVTLEPCSHFGRTPPCAEALVRAGVKRVVAAMQDPNPQVAGRGLKRLADAGIEVVCGVLEAEARTLNPGFVKRMTTGLPFVRIKLAMSLDGRTAMASGESQWITGPAARAEVQRLRAQSSVVLTGADTVLMDEARLTVRGDELELDAEQTALALKRPPLRVVVDSKRRVPLRAAFFQAGPTLVASLLSDKAEYYSLQGHELLTLPEKEGHVDLQALLALLAERGVNEVLVEAGPQLAGAFARQGLVDEYHFFIAPKLMGSTARPLLDWPLTLMSEAAELDIVQTRLVGRDWYVVARPISSQAPTFS